jgi:hypothetical protein
MRQIGALQNVNIFAKFEKKESIYFMFTVQDVTNGITRENGTFCWLAQKPIGLLI